MTAGPDRRRCTGDERLLSLGNGSRSQRASICRTLSSHPNRSRRLFPPGDTASDRQPGRSATARANDVEDRVRTGLPEVDARSNEFRGNRLADGARALAPVGGVLKLRAELLDEADNVHGRITGLGARIDRDDVIGLGAQLRGTDAEQTIEITDRPERGASDVIAVSGLDPRCNERLVPGAARWPRWSARSSRISTPPGSRGAATSPSPADPPGRPKTRFPRAPSCAMPARDGDGAPRQPPGIVTAMPG